MKRDKETVKKAFVAVCNTARPDHVRSSPTFGRKTERRPRDDVYPLDVDDVEWSYCQAQGRFVARCGPASSRSKPVLFAGDWERLREMDRERLLTVLVHESAHITEGSQTPGSGHNPAFWRCVAFHASEVLDNPGDVVDVLGEFHRDDYLASQISEPNRSMTDRRMVTVDEQRQRLLDLLWPWTDDPEYVVREAGLDQTSERLQAASDTAQTAGKSE